MPERIVKSREIGATIRSRRKELGLSQEALAEKVGISYQQIQRYENGRTMLNVENMQRIAQVLSIPVSGLFDKGEAESPPAQEAPLTNNEEKNLLRSFRSLGDEADRKLAIHIVRRLAKRKEGNR